MNSVEINKALGQIHALRDQLSGTVIKTESPNPVDFGSLLKNSIDQVNESQHYAKNLAQSFEIGEEGINLADVMIASQKASLSFQATVQVRNKLVEAYKDIMNMPM
jgi:flagellar hook-basal body complex protein FliE